MAASAKYAGADALALRQIKAKGALVTFTRVATALDPVTQQISTAPSTFTARAIAFPLSPGKARYLFGDGADVTKARLTVYITLNGATGTPRNGDRFTWGGRAYAIIQIDELNPDGGGAFFQTALAEAA